MISTIECILLSLGQFSSSSPIEKHSTTASVHESGSPAVVFVSRKKEGGRGGRKAHTSRWLFRITIAAHQTILWYKTPSQLAMSAFKERWDTVWHVVEATGGEIKEEKRQRNLQLINFSFLRNIICSSLPRSRWEPLFALTFMSSMFRNNECVPCAQSLLFAIETKRRRERNCFFAIQSFSILNTKHISNLSLTQSPRIDPIDSNVLRWLISGRRQKRLVSKRKSASKLSDMHNQSELGLGIACRCILSPELFAM